MNNRKIWLNEISFMRPFLLLLLVSYHAFAPYCGAWEIPSGIENCEFYKWVANFSRAFRLEAFVFVSGYIFTFQLLTKNKFHSLLDLTYSKVSRLLVPSIFFGLCYLLLFESVSFGISSFYKIIDGPGHLWYLPCLFWLFLAQYIIVFLTKKYSTDRKRYLKIQLLLFVFLVVISFLSVAPIPLRINRSIYYIAFFYGGGLFYEYSKKIGTWTTKGKNVIFWLVFVLSVFLLFPIMDLCKENKDLSTYLINRMFYAAVSVYIKMFIAWIGISALYMTAVLYCRTHSIGKFMLKVGTCGYGVYVFHQFILRYLYYEIDFPLYTGTIMMPWIGFFLTVGIATILTLSVRLTKIGRKFL